MSGSELAVLSRAHRLFTGRARGEVPPVGIDHFTELLGRGARLHNGDGQRAYRRAVRAQQAVLAAAARTDAAAAGVATAARTDHARAREQTKSVVDAARADTVVTFDNPLAEREAIRRRATRLRLQRAHVLAAHERALRHQAAFRRLRYPGSRRRENQPVGLTLPPAGSRAGQAVWAALSRLGQPYVWGATGPDQFDCSGLTQWSYAQAGVHLHRTTYQQIQDGIPVSRSHIRAGDLVFPSVDHVQLAIGDNLVIEAPHTGAAVRVSPLGSYVAIRRPLP